MGQVLSEPVTEKHTTHGADDRLAYAVSEMQGWRLSMEDAHAHILDLDALPQTESSTALKQRRSFFAVYDGHGGSTVAKFAGDTVHSRLTAQNQFQAKDYSAALTKTFLATDEDLRSNPSFQGDPSGCTAVAIVIAEDDKIYCANAGDSRSVMSIKGEVKALSFDHKPVNKGENARIVAAGGFVEFGRVNGNLALSRAMGDFEFKSNSSLEAEKQVVTVDPEITIHESTPDDEFVIIACDGIWDVMDSQAVVDYFRRSIAQGTSLDKITEDIMDRCLAPDSDCSGVGCDNMTIMVVALLRGKTQEQWYKMISERVESGSGYETPQLEDLPKPFRPRQGGVMGFGGGNQQQGNANASAASRLGAVLRGNSLIYNSQGEDDGYGGNKPVYHMNDSEEEEDEEGLLSNLQAALRREGIHITAAGQEDETSSGSEHSEMEIDSAEEMDKPKLSHRDNDEIAPAVVRSEGLMDKSEDPTRQASS